IPNDVLIVAHDKSSWARRGLAVQNTIFDPGWRGYATLELTNHGRSSLAILAGDPIAQVVCHLLTESTTQPYAGKYQDQEAGPQHARDDAPRCGDGIEHPAHYGGADNPYEAINVIEAWSLNFNLGNVVKYISRAGKKGDALEDLKKA